MTARTIDLILAPGNHAARPAAADVPGGSLYSCTEHAKVYRNNDAGDTWTDFLDLSGFSTGTPDLADLGDVDTTTDPPGDGDRLVWDAGDSLWKPAPGSSVSALDDLTDVDAAAPADQDVLTWDAGASEWIPAAPSGGGGGLVYPLDPVTLNATYGDHFTGADLNTGTPVWNRAGTYVTADDSAADSWLTVIGRQSGSYYWQTAPGGNFTIVMKCAVGFIGTSMWGVLCVDASGVGIGAGLYNSSPNGPLLGNVSSGAYTSGFQGTNLPVGNTAANGGPLWIKVIKTGTSWQMAASATGENWGPLTAAHTNSTTITRIGFGTFSGAASIFQVDYFDVQ